MSGTAERMERKREQGSGIVQRTDRRRERLQRERKENVGSIHIMWCVRNYGRARDERPYLESVLAISL